MKKLFLILSLTAVLAVSAFALDLADVANVVPVDNISCDYTAPELKESVRPERIVINNREIEGYVTLELRIDTEGVVQNAKVLYKTSHLAVNNAVEAVSNWKFTAATLDGQAVSSLVAYNVPFGRNLDVFAEDSYAVKIINSDDTMLALGK
jgi:TonB family protein